MNSDMNCDVFHEMRDFNDSLFEYRWKIEFLFVLFVKLRLNEEQFILRSIKTMKLSVCTKYTDNNWYCQLVQRLQFIIS